MRLRARACKDIVGSDLDPWFKDFLIVEKGRWVEITEYSSITEVCTFLDHKEISWYNAPLSLFSEIEQFSGKV